MNKMKMGDIDRMGVENGPEASSCILRIEYARGVDEACFRIHRVVIIHAFGKMAGERIRLVLRMPHREEYVLPAVPFEQSRVIEVDDIGAAPTVMVRVDRKQSVHCLPSVQA